MRTVTLMMLLVVDPVLPAPTSGEQPHSDAVAARSLQLPAKVLDLSNWKLTLPVNTAHPGNPDEIKQPQLQTFSNRNSFFVRPDGSAVLFRAPCGGVTTKGSNYPRSELREMTNGGRKPAAWGTDDGSVHTMTLKCAILKTPAVKPHVVCAQIHNADDDVIMVRLEGRKLFIERNSSGDVSLDRKYRLGRPVELKIQAGRGRIKVWLGATLKMDWAVARKGCYFKMGCYTQSNRKKGDASDAYGEVAVYRLKVTHRKMR